MVFSSTIFLFIFLPVFLGLYYALPKRSHSLMILIASYAFYGWWRVDFLVLFAFVTLFNYVISKAIVRSSPHNKKALIFGVAGNLLVLGYFKYFNFGVGAFNNLLGYIGFEQVSAWTVILPIGISFYIFQAISYLVDVYRADARPAESFIDFAAFISLFPQLIAGPVLRYKDVADQFHDRRHTKEKFTEGSVRFAMGFCKKILIADTLAPIADQIFALNNPSLADSWMGALAYTAQLYYDFSGYSDMAIGLGLMMGFRFIENFNQPYVSCSITEFWQRWHISLSTWLRDYLYIPLGGNRKGILRTYINLILTMLLGGFWHGANWTFLLWGGWHGVIMAVERYRSGGDKSRQIWPRFFAWPLTFLFVVFGWVMFRAASVSKAFDMYAGMIGLHDLDFSDSYVWSVTNLQIFTLFAAFGLFFLTPYLVGTEKRVIGGKTWAYELPSYKQAGVMLLFIIAVSKLIAQSFSPFLYFQF